VFRGIFLLTSCNLTSSISLFCIIQQGETPRWRPRQPRVGSIWPLTSATSNPRPVFLCSHSGSQSIYHSHSKDCQISVVITPPWLTWVQCSDLRPAASREMVHIKPVRWCSHLIAYHSFRLLCIQTSSLCI
jgi:hypothetical protein